MNARFLAMKAAKMPALAATLPHTPAPVRVADETPEFVSPPASVPLESRVAALELKAQYDGEYIARLESRLAQAGEVIDALTIRVHNLANELQSLQTLRAGLSTR